MPSLRRHLLLGAAASISAVFAILAAILYLSVRSWLIAEFDRGLLAQAQSLRAATEFHHGKVRIDFDGEQPAQFVGGLHAQYFELWEAGRPIAKSPSLGGRDLPPPSVSLNSSEYRFDRLLDGMGGRQISTAFELRGDPQDQEDRPERSKPLHTSLTLVVARDTSQLRSELSQLRWLLAASCGAALLIGLGLLAWIIGRGLRPVNAIAGRIARVGRRSLSDRLEPSGVPRELLPIVDRLNGMLERLGLAFSRERAFTADVAHELRTPLAGLETAIEVCASRTRQPQEYQKVLSQCLGVTRQMHAMVDSLLILARADGRTLVVSQTSFCLTTLLNETWKPFADRAARRRLHLIRSGEPDGPICSDREKLRQILHNLFDNAVSYADEGGTLTIRIAAQAGLVSIVVANSGSRLSQDQADHAFERFWRGDAARSETGSHCGLGLAITRELVTVIGGTISLNSSEGGDFLVHLTLPATPHQASPAKESDSPRSASRADVVSV